MRYNDRSVQKNRRFDRGLGYTKDLKGVLGNVGLGVIKSGDVCTPKSKRVSQKEPREIARIAAGM